MVVNWGKSRPNNRRIIINNGNKSNKTINILITPSTKFIEESLKAILNTYPISSNSKMLNLSNHITKTLPGP